MKHKIFHSILIVPLITLSACSNANSDITQTKQENAVTSTPKVYALRDVSKHTTKTDCWIAIGGNVYDVTPSSSSGKHPGGDAILEGCGKDATTLFETRPMGSGTPHSEKARGYLENFKIGTLQ